MVLKSLWINSPRKTFTEKCQFCNISWMELLGEIHVRIHWPSSHSSYASLALWSGCIITTCFPHEELGLIFGIPGEEQPGIGLASEFPIDLGWGYGNRITPVFFLESGSPVPEKVGSSSFFPSGILWLLHLPDANFFIQSELKRMAVFH